MSAVATAVKPSTPPVHLNEAVVRDLTIGWGRLKHQVVSELARLGIANPKLTAKPSFGTLATGNGPKIQMTVDICLGRGDKSATPEGAAKIIVRIGPDGQFTYQMVNARPLEQATVAKMVACRLRGFF